MNMTEYAEKIHKETPEDMSGIVHTPVVSIITYLRGAEYLSMKSHILLCGGWTSHLHAMVTQEVSLGVS
jgi:hypothetical protein